MKFWIYLNCAQMLLNKKDKFPNYESDKLSSVNLRECFFFYLFSTVYMRATYRVIPVLFIVHRSHLLHTPRNKRKLFVFHIRKIRSLSLYVSILESLVYL